MLRVGVDENLAEELLADFPPEATKLPQVGGFMTPDEEAILVKRPDLIVLAHGNPRVFIDRLRARKIPVFVLHPQKVADIPAATPRVESDGGPLRTITPPVGETTAVPAADPGTSSLGITSEELTQVTYVDRVGPHQTFSALDLRDGHDFATGRLDRVGDPWPQPLRRDGDRRRRHVGRVTLEER